MELQMFLDNAQADLATAREQLDSMETEHKELANEYIALKTSHVQLTADYQKEVGTTATFCAVLCFKFILSSLKRSIGALSICQNWPAGSLPDQSVSK